MITVGVLGFQGFVGSAIFQALKERSSIHTVGINRHSFEDNEIRKLRFDYLIHSGNPAGRFYANSNPQDDYHETVEKTRIILREFNFNRFFLVSSLSCRTAPNTPYGSNRLKCEQIVRKVLNATILRLGPMYGGTRTRDTLHDLVHSRDIFYAKDTKYSYADIAWIGKFFASNLCHFSTDLFEIGAKNFVSLEEIAFHIGSKSRFLGPNDDQIIRGFQDGPDARLVLNFALGLKESNSI